MNLIKKKTNLISLGFFLFVQTSAYIETGVRHSTEQAIWLGQERGCSCPARPYPLSPASSALGDICFPNLRAQTHLSCSSQQGTF